MIQNTMGIEEDQNLDIIYSSIAEVFKEGSKMTKRNMSKYYDYKEKAVFFNNKKKDLLI